MIRFEDNFFGTGHIVLHGGLQDPDVEEISEFRQKALKALNRLKQTPMFTVYMGHVREEIETIVLEARKHGVEVHVLDSLEDWGYDFIAVRSNVFVVDKEKFRYNPFNEIELSAELEFTPNDLREVRIYPSTFIYGAVEVAPDEIPPMIKAQLIALEQAVPSTKRKKAHATTILPNK